MVKISGSAHETWTVLTANSNAMEIMVANFNLNAVYSLILKLQFVFQNKTFNHSRIQILPNKTFNYSGIHLQVTKTCIRIPGPYRTKIYK